MQFLDLMWSRSACKLISAVGEHVFKSTCAGCAICPVFFLVVLVYRAVLSSVSSKGIASPLSCPARSGPKLFDLVDQAHQKIFHLSISGPVYTQGKLHQGSNHTTRFKCLRKIHVHWNTKKEPMANNLKKNIS